MLVLIESLVTANCCTCIALGLSQAAGICQHKRACGTFELPTQWYTNIQARSQEGFEGVRTNPPCSLAKFIFNETAAVQGTIIQPCSGIVTDGIQAIMQLLQGVVTYTSPVEAFATGIKNFDR